MDMQNATNILQEEKVITATMDIPWETEDYAALLLALGIAHELENFYLKAGQPVAVQGWILHISTIKRQFPAVLQAILPVLQERKLPFRIPATADIKDHIIEGHLGIPDQGKVITVYPENDAAAVQIAKELIAATAGFTGPAIPTDIHLGHLVYTRYGGHTPQVLLDEQGLPGKYIYDHKGRLTKDNYPVPFKMPAGIKWPFREITAFKIPRLKKIFRNKYLPYIIIKPDPKGRVIKGINITRFNWCLIKEGKRNMFADDHGRNITERLQWQRFLHEELSDKVPIPKIIDYFEDDGDVYLVMDFVEGVCLDDYYRLIFNSNTWNAILTSSKITILNYLLEIIDHIDILHKNGYIHRDITTANFMISTRKKIVMIDLELAYNIKINRPDPPFKLGTPGYMSPEQENTEHPDPAQDIYSIGAMLLATFSSFQPLLFTGQDTEIMEENIHYFIHDNTVANLIIQCLHHDPAARPQIEEIAAVLQTYRDRLNDADIIGFQAPEKDRIQAHVIQAIKGLAHPKMLSLNYWLSPTINEEGIKNQGHLDKTFYAGLHEGVSGVIYLLAYASGRGFDISTAAEQITANWNIVLSHYLALLPELAPGLYAGSAGIALALNAGIRAGIFPDDATNKTYLQRSLDIPLGGLDLANGAAGIGLAVLQCSDALDTDFTVRRLQELTDYILKAQQSNGSWTFSKDRKSGTILGFSFGVAGIILFLLECSEFLENKTIADSAFKALRWLTAQRKEENGIHFWKDNTMDSEGDYYLGKGTCGITLAYIRAYELSGDPLYREIAENALSGYPENLLTRNTTQSYGMSGLGEVYLEAYRVFGNEKWKQRAERLAGILLHTAQVTAAGNYWLTDNPELPHADLMIGNAGIIRFLIRCLDPFNTRPFYSPVK
ncbi:protein kinase [Chitinophaga sp. Mgbs1]|uniref:Protein kinase n=1 Tax=Chitinophaga solisilvae TaxID=1233460 RepID=A0A433WQ48_9BACT|nr:protein kinase [Chitinophaga solisilvae]